MRYSPTGARPTFSCFTDSTNAAEAVAGRYGTRTASPAFRAALQALVGELELLLREGARIHSVEALQWIPRRYNLGADHLAKMARGGSASWMVRYPQSVGGADIVACTDAGICVEEGCATQGGFLFARASGECLAMWRERRQLGDGEVVDVNAEESRAVETALGLLRLLLGRRWESWATARLAIGCVMSDPERRTVRLKHKQAWGTWQRESVEARGV